MKNKLQKVSLRSPRLMNAGSTDFPAGSGLNTDSELVKLSKMIKETQRFYILLSMFTISTSILNYPFQKYLSIRGVAQSEIEQLRGLLFYPWMVKPLFAYFGDAFRPFKYRVKGYVFLLCPLIAGLSAANALFFEQTTFVIASTAVIVVCLVTVDTLAQGLTVMALDFENRYYFLTNVGNPQGKGDWKTDSYVTKESAPKLHSGSCPTEYTQAEDEAVSKSHPKPSYIKNFAIYTFFQSISRAVYLLIAFSTESEQQYKYINLGIAVFALAVLLYSMSFEELRQAQWMRSRDSNLPRVPLSQILVRALGGGRWLLLTFMTLTLCNPLNYLHEFMLAVLRDDYGFSSFYISAAVFTAGLLICCTIAYFTRNKAHLSFRGYFLAAVVSIAVMTLAGLGIELRAFEPSLPTNYAYVATGFFAHDLVPILARFSFVEHFVRGTPLNTFQFVFVNSLTALVNAAQYCSYLVFDHLKGAFGITVAGYASLYKLLLLNSAILLAVVLAYFSIKCAKPQLFTLPHL